MPAVADMQNIVVKEFENNPNVVVALVNEFGVVTDSDPQRGLEILWSSLYLRGQVILDATGTNSRRYYNQPWTGLPFGRTFIIDADGQVVTTMFGYNPRKIIEKIYEVLEE